MSNILEKIISKAKLNPAKIAFPEAENPVMLKAIKEAVDRDIVVAKLIGDKEKILLALKTNSIAPNSVEIIDTSDEILQENLVDKYLEQVESLYGKKALLRRSSQPLYYALMLEAIAQVDCTFAGLESSTGNVILSAQTILGIDEDIPTISSSGIIDIPGYHGSEGSVIGFGDSGVCQNPNAEELANIAIATCDTLKTLLDWEPRCALLSYSTLGSGEGILVEKVVDAVKIANKKRPDLLIEGEFQLDTAINSEVAKKKAGVSKVAGKANILIWPDLNAGNIGVKLMQQFGGGVSFGPILQGFKKTIADCSRGASVEELVGNIAIASLRASSNEK